MKFTFKLITALAALVCTLSVSAQNINVSPVTGPWYAYSVAGSTNGVDAKTSWAVIDPNSASGGAPVVNYVAWGSDLLSAAIQFYTTTNSTSVNTTNYSTLTVIPVASTNGFTAAAGDVIVVYHKANATFERRLTTATGAALTNLAVTVALNSAAQIGDQVFKMVTDGSIPTGIGTNTLTATSLYYGNPGQPVLVEITGTAAGAAKLNLVNARYDLPWMLFKQQY